MYKMNTAKYIFLLLLLITFAVGFTVCLSRNETESFRNMFEEKQEQVKRNCPDLLVNRPGGLFLINSSLPDIDPIRFSNLDEYIEYAENHKDCPVLFLQQENDAQGNDTYRLRPSPFSMDGGTTPVPIVDAGRENPPYNQDMYPGFDAHGRDIGTYTSMDVTHDSTEKELLSDNPMDPNWGGVTFSQESVLSDKYADNVVGKPTMVPKVIQRM